MRIVTCAGVALLAASAAACGPRQVEVRTAPVPASGIALEVRNTLAQAVNVYVTSGGTDTFVQQVGANSTVTIPVQGFVPGSTVALKAVTIDGGRTFTRANVVLNGTYVFPLP